MEKLFFCLLIILTVFPFHVYAESYFNHSDNRILSNYTYLDDIDGSRIYYKVQSRKEKKGSSFNTYDVVVYEKDLQNDYYSTAYHLKFIHDEKKKDLSPYTITDYKDLSLRSSDYRGNPILMENPDPEKNKEEYVHSRVIHAVLEDGTKIPVFKGADNLAGLKQYREHEFAKFHLYSRDDKKEIYYKPLNINNSLLNVTVYEKKLQQPLFSCTYNLSVYWNFPNDEILFRRTGWNNYVFNNSSLKMNAFYYLQKKTNAERPNIDQSDDFKEFVRYLVKGAKNKTIKFEEDERTYPVGAEFHNDPDFMYFLYKQDVMRGENAVPEENTN